ncbi:MAG: hypothetical protein JW789_02980 [Candidatus Aenigmarchaeota archaeon]|nr:hypothetical protein [Candidatus Aenigmarchaeota archaeon]
MVKKELLASLMNDLNVIHNSTDTALKETDDRVIKMCTCKNEKVPEEKIEEVRMELWLDYIFEQIENIEEVLITLSKALVAVKSYKTKMHKYRRKHKEIVKSYEFEDISESSQLLKDVKKLFNEVIELWNEIVDNEDDMRTEAWKNFLVKIYLPYGIAVTTGYWTIFRIYLPAMDLIGSLFFYTATMLVLYWLLKYLILHPPKESEKEKGSTEKKV